MDKTQTIHIISEIAVITMMYLHFNKKMKNMQEEIEHIKKTYISTFDDLYQKIELLKQGILVNNNSVNMQKQVINDLKNIKPFEPKISVLEEEETEKIIKPILNEQKITTIKEVEEEEDVIKKDEQDKVETEQVQETQISDLELTEIEEIIENEGKTS